ncbi:hypothetical protein D3C87_1458460 [compost metagenome]
MPVLSKARFNSRGLPVTGVPLTITGWLPVPGSTQAEVKPSVRVTSDKPGTQPCEASLFFTARKAILLCGRAEIRVGTSKIKPLSA